MSKNIWDVSIFPRSEALHRIVQSFEEKMVAERTMADGVLTARVVGEYSAGKTRLLRELFGDMIPEPLFPVSSLERQTRLQLEITYGDTPKLTLIQRSADFDPAVTLSALAHFPERDELAGYDPLQNRLRLAIPEPRLILETGDGYSDDKQPKRLFLIDTPGWNSGDDDLAESPASSVLTGFHNLALVYVCQASRLDGILNADRLREFLEALADADFLDKAKLLFILTHCPTQDAQRFKKRAQALVERLWHELDRDPDELTLDIFPVEFQEMTTVALQSFREEFWLCLLGPLNRHESTEAPSLVNAMRSWPKEWGLNTSLEETYTMLQRAELMLKRARKGDEFVGGMNMHRLVGMSKPDMCKKVKNAWLKQLNCTENELTSWALPRLPDGHHLSDWWKHFWVLNFEQTIASVRYFFAEADKAIDDLTPETKDIDQYLKARLSGLYIDACNAINNSFCVLVRTSKDLIKEPAVEKQVATLLSLSLLQARYEDYYMQSLSSISAQS